MNGTARTVAGIDGCRAGWVMATAGVTPGTGGLVHFGVELLTELGPVIGRVRSGALAAVAIDIPIGLPADGPRPADVAARARIGPRRSSVFPAPVRPVLAARTYDDACAVSRAASGRAISRQLFAILPKIVEVDAVMSPALQARLFEMHPEVSFTELSGTPMQFHKSSVQGRRERLRALRRVFPTIDAVAATKLRGARDDDLLDATVGAWTAARFVAGTHRQLGGELDETGLRMEIIA